MKSPRFADRRAILRQTIDEGRLRFTWRKKVRGFAQRQFLVDPIDHMDTQLDIDEISLALAKQVTEGDYQGHRPARLLMEKSRGLCRQLVIPHIYDLLVLQCLSDAFYSDIKGEAPSDKAYFEPEANPFSNQVSRAAGPYGSRRAWLNFQRELLRFSSEKKFLVVTDISNYYDFINFVHLRHVISDNIKIREPVLDLLIYLLSNMLWQPDYMPRVEIGLPQINADAPRILAHCFLFELDKNMVGRKIEYARYMDDINVGTDSAADARRILRDVDLILQTRQLRLNSGKTRILTRDQALEHYRVNDNIHLDKIESLATRAEGDDRELMKKFVRRSIVRGIRDDRFSSGAGDKILKRYLTVGARLGLKLGYETSLKMLIRYPAVRQNWYWHMKATEFDRDDVAAFLSFLRSGFVVDQAPIALFADSLVNCRFFPDGMYPYQLIDLLEELNQNEFYHQYSRLWLLWRFGGEGQLFEALAKLASSFHNDHFLGRLAGGMAPRFAGSPYDNEFRKLPIIRHNSSAQTILNFISRISNLRRLPRSIRPIIFAANKKHKNRLTPQKFNLLLAIAKAGSLIDLDQLIEKHSFALTDIYYRETWLESGLALVQVQDEIP